MHVGLFAWVMIVQTQERTRTTGTMPGELGSKTVFVPDEIKTLLPGVRPSMFFLGLLLRSGKREDLHGAESFRMRIFMLGAASQLFRQGLGMEDTGIAERQRTPGGLAA